MQRQDRRRFLKTVGATGALLTTGTAAATPDEGKREGASGTQNLVQFLAKTDGFDVLVAAVQEAGLVDVLSGNRQLTVFGPTDKAFNDAGITVDNVGDVDDEFLLNVLQYHVTSGRRYASSIVNAPQVQTLLGQPVTVETIEGTVVLNGGQANITGINNEANNGVAHVIDGVLLP
jgi:uncharacterized surface protein with fasciclin (FAS1) repeats